MTTDDAAPTDAEHSDEPGILHIPADGPALAVTQDALDLIGDAWGANANTIVVPAGRFDPAFFDLSTGLLGEVTQKFVNYRIRLVVIGDITEHVAASKAFRDYLWETNGGDHIWFVADQADLATRLGVDA